LFLFHNLPEVIITHEISCNNQGLIVTDFICGTFGYKYNTKSLEDDYDKYVNLIKDKIIVEKNDLFKKCEPHLLVLTSIPEASSFQWDLLTN